MRITFTQSGGFAGLLKRCSVDTAALGPEERTRVETLVAAAGWEASWEKFSEGRDRFQYAIAIERDTTVHVTCDDACVPPEARPLVAYLKEHAAAT
ncbi:MAG: protealysin inhibitor emfourin [Planctomycetia bacterium]